MKSKTLEVLLARESGLQSDMVTRFQKLRDNNLLGRSRGRNAEMLTSDEVVSGILSMVAAKPGFAGMTTIGLRKLKPVGVVEDAFSNAPTLAAALALVLTNPDLLDSVSEVQLGDSDKQRGMPTSAAILYHDAAGQRITQYVHENALSLFHKGAERSFDRRSLSAGVVQETIVAKRVFGRIADEMARAKAFEEAFPDAMM